MIKQVYRFLSILLISNMLFSQAVLSKTNATDKTSTPTCACQHKSLFQRLFGCKKAEEQKNDSNQTTNTQPVIQPQNNDDLPYVTKYGVYFNDDIYNTYPQTKPENKKD